MKIFDPPLKSGMQRDLQEGGGGGVFQNAVY